MWGCREESPGSTEEPKCPLLLRTLACCWPGRKEPGCGRPADPGPSSEMQNVPQLTEADGEPWGLERVVGRRLSQDQGPSWAGGP